MTKHYFTAIFVSGFSGRAVLQFTEPDGSTVVREDVRDTEDMQDWWTSLDSEIEIEYLPPGIYRITGYGVMNDDHGWLDYYADKITPAKSYSFNFE